MDWLNLIFILFVVVSLVPIIRQKMVETTRVRLIRDLEVKRGSRVITLIHRQESLSFLGFQFGRFIDIQDSEQVLRAIKLTDPKVPIDLILHTPGGLVLAAEQIANALTKHPAPVTVFVPHYAMSGGTLIALAAGKIVMDENAVLGPVDPQIGQFPAASILSVLEKKDANRVDDQTMILADLSRKAVRQVRELVLRLLNGRYPAETAEKITEALVSGQWTHDYPITVEEARELGLPVETGMPTVIYQLMNLFPQSAQRRPSVEYIPLPYPYRPATPEHGKQEA